MSLRATCLPLSRTSATASPSSSYTGPGTASAPGWSCLCTPSERGGLGEEDSNIRVPCSAAMHSAVGHPLRRLGHICIFGFSGKRCQCPSYHMYACRLATGCALTECAYFGGLALLWRANPVATMWLMVVPFLITSFGLMIGNW